MTGCSVWKTTLQTRLLCRIKRNPFGFVSPDLHQIDLCNTTLCLGCLVRWSDHSGISRGGHSTKIFQEPEATCKAAPLHRLQSHWWQSRGDEKLGILPLPSRNVSAWQCCSWQSTRVSLRAECLTLKNFCSSIWALDPSPLSHMHRIWWSEPETNFGKCHSICNTAKHFKLVHFILIHFMNQIITNWVGISNVNIRFPNVTAIAPAHLHLSNFGRLLSKEVPFKLTPDNGHTVPPHTHINVCMCARMRVHAILICKIHILRNIRQKNIGRTLIICKGNWCKVLKILQAWQKYCNWVWLNIHIPLVQPPCFRT